MRRSFLIRAIAIVLVDCLVAGPVPAVSLYQSVLPGRQVSLQVVLFHAQAVSVPQQEFGQPLIHNRVDQATQHRLNDLSRRNAGASDKSIMGEPDRRIGPYGIAGRVTAGPLVRLYDYLKDEGFSEGFIQLIAAPLAQTVYFKAFFFGLPLLLAHVTGNVWLSDHMVDILMGSAVLNAFVYGSKLAHPNVYVKDQMRKAGFKDWIWLFFRDVIESGVLLFCLFLAGNAAVNAADPTGMGIAPHPAPPSLEYFFFWGLSAGFLSDVVLYAFFNLLARVFGWSSGTVTNAKIPEASITPGLRRFLELHPNSVFLPTRSLNSGDLPASPQSVLPQHPSTESIPWDNIPPVELRPFLERPIILTNSAEIGPGDPEAFRVSVTAYLADGRPVRASSFFFPPSVDREGEVLYQDPFLDNPKLYIPYLRHGYLGSRVAAGFGPEVYGISKDATGRWWLISDATPGDVPESMPASIGVQTIEDVIDIGYKLSPWSGVLGGLQYFVTPDGRLRIVNAQMLSQLIEALAHHHFYPQPLVNWRHRLLAWLWDLASEENKALIQRHLELKHQGLLSELRQMLSKPPEARDLYIENRIGRFIPPSRRGDIAA